MTDSSVSSHPQAFRAVIPYWHLKSPCHITHSSKKALPIWAPSSYTWQIPHCVKTHSLIICDISDVSGGIKWLKNVFKIYFEASLTLKVCIYLSMIIWHSPGGRSGLTRISATIKFKQLWFSSTWSCGSRQRVRVPPFLPCLFVMTSVLFSSQITLNITSLFVFLLTHQFDEDILFCVCCSRWISISVLFVVILTDIMCNW